MNVNRWLKLLAHADASGPIPTLEELLALVYAADGYTRQAAVEALAEIGDPRVLPQLLERANDWVSQVRHAARVAIESFLRDDCIDGWIAALPKLAALSRARRADHSGLLLRIEAFLARPGNLERLASVQHATSHVAARWLFAFRARHVLQAATRLSLVRDGLISSDIGIAGAALAAARGMPPGTPRDNLLGAACLSRFAKVRAAGLRELLCSPQVSTPSLVREMCMDASPLVRSIALAAVGDDLAGVLERAAATLRSGSHTAREGAVALQLISAARPADALQACAKAIRSPAAVLRRAGYAVLWSRSAADVRSGLVLQMLSDPSAKVRRLAVDYVGRGAEPPPLAALESLAARPELLRSMLSVLVHTSPWDRLLVLLRLQARMAAPDQAATERVVQALQAWCADMTRTFVQPAARHQELLATAWPEWRACLDAGLASRIEFHLHAFGLGRST